ncbi:MAG: GntR family transcriptional regulator [Frankiaceae bacterium]|nr:GntR family transcriptional regulator [Frankiaceae bacterium]
MASTAVGGRVMRAGGSPYYVQVADHLRGEITSGRWTPGELIPSEAGLCDAFGVSRTAIRQALGALVAEGLLHKEKGRGTFVSRPHVSLAVQETRGFFDEMADLGRRVDTTILLQDKAVIPPALAPELGVSMGSDVVRLQRIRAVGDENFIFVTTYLPLPRFAEILELNLEYVSLYAVLNEKFGVEARTGRRRIEAVRAVDPIARHLRVPTGSPLLRVTAVNVDRTGAPFEVFEGYYRGDRTAFEVDVATRNASS